LPLFPPEPFGLADELDEPVGPVGEDGDGPVEGVGTVEDEFGAHDADTLRTGPTPAGTIDAGGVPGGTFTLKVSVCPVNNVTVTEH
jgi:hypothetical protein